MGRELLHQDLGKAALKVRTPPKIKILTKIACLPTKHIGVHMNSFKRVRAFQIELEFGSVGF